MRPGANTEYLKANLGVQPWVERFEKEGREIFDQRERILRALEVRPGMGVADVGAGTGLFTLLMANAVGPKGTVYAVDIAKEFLRHIDERARQTERETSGPCSAPSARLSCRPTRSHGLP